MGREGSCWGERFPRRVKNNLKVKKRDDSYLSSVALVTAGYYPIEEDTFSRKKLIFFLGGEIDSF